MSSWVLCFLHNGMCCQVTQLELQGGPEAQREMEKDATSDIHMAKTILTTFAASWGLSSEPSGGVGGEERGEGICASRCIDCPLQTLKVIFSPYLGGNYTLGRGPVRIGLTWNKKQPLTPGWGIWSEHQDEGEDGKQPMKAVMGDAGRQRDGRQSGRRWRNGEGGKGSLCGFESTYPAVSCPSAAAFRETFANPTQFRRRVQCGRIRI
ncbi:unnamed protein product [Pleuronectes platessa]|uniref:Uncharacterized protein n=1 Tax=Pleuronectes platessa TaxID=8262 RepID=A0A9N7UP25_PLEPL|nr:unnamed protein product [Pleuronectes platessa]